MLDKIPLFSGLPEEALTKIEQHGSIKSYKKNTIVINEGDETDSLYVILSGRVKVFLSGEDGREAVLNHQGPGEYFGEMALIDRQPRAASVMTLEPSRFMIISRGDFMDCLAANPEIAMNLIRPLNSRIRMLAGFARRLWSRGPDLVAACREGGWEADYRQADPAGDRRYGGSVTRHGQPDPDRPQDRWLYQHR
jgi:CRP/FNR family cyclic AMP-dependent transcriptional regulator